MFGVASKLNLFRVAAIAVAGLSILVFSAGYTISDAARLQTLSLTQTSDGLRTVVVENEEGRVTVKLPDDIRTGDKISGTLITEPKGATKEEQEANLAALRKRRLRLMLTKASGGTLDPVALSVPLSAGQTSSVKTELKQGNTLRVEFTASEPVKLATDDSGIKELGRVLIPVDLVETAQTKPEPTPKMPVKKTPGMSFVSFADYDTLGGSEQKPEFEIPSLGQTGRPIEIKGTFDGDSSNTSVSVSMTLSNLMVDVIAESPRRSIVANPQNLVGPGTISLNEAGRKFSAPFRNIGVGLSAPKTSLMRGEKTEMRVEVTGLAGITQPVPMTLSSSGVVTMSGGSFQQIMIKPSDAASGNYVTTRTINGLQAGSWGAVATVIVREFDITLQDDVSPRRRLTINSFTGAYSLLGAAEDGLTGKAKIDIKDCVLTFEHKADGRNISATIDRCQHNGRSSIELLKGQPKILITDSDTADNLSP
ncbi:MAG TPA: hypothetical protein PLL77_04585 [Pyrinomonadaceae bacterium]|nr:hypothetical protein [Pyrinomonadaceae bacterium]